MSCLAGCLSFLGAGPKGGRALDPVLAALSDTLGEYAIGHALGQGTFGTVYAGTERSTGRHIAVKLLDRARIRTDVIEAEASFLRGLDHRNIVGFRGLHFAPGHACLVMDRYNSDLVLGHLGCMPRARRLQRHLRIDSRPIPCRDLVHIARQMAAAVKYLHTVCVVHRDVKADNFLMDRQDLRDANCRVALGDFGAACMLYAGDRLSAPVGTKTFWAPEFYSMNYGLKVDVWALGVTMYSLLHAQYPFANEDEVRHMPPQLSRRLPPACRDFIQVMLQKDESLRPDAESIAQHQWIGDGLARPREEARLSSKAASEADDCCAHGDLCVKRGTWRERECSLSASTAPGSDRSLPATSCREDFSIVPSIAGGATPVGASSECREPSLGTPAGGGRPAASEGTLR